MKTSSDSTLPKSDCEAVTEQLTAFIADTIKNAGREVGVLGRSGGVDSAVVLELASRAIGPSNVVAVSMPYGEESPDVALLRTKAILEYDPIDPQIDLYYQFGNTDPHSDINPLRLGNKCARERMAILYDYAAEYSGLVIGTSNKSEILLGYGTLHGDIACDLNPLASLYKTQVYQLAEYLGVPQQIIDKPPSADLWEGQTDEGELGYSYEVIDKVLYLVGDCWSGPISQEVLDEKTVTDIKQRMIANAFKQRGPVTP